MSDNRKVAAKLLIEAENIISRQRGNSHGGAEDSFEMIGDYWTMRLKHILRYRHNAELPADFRIAPADVAWMMADLKQARNLYGDPGNKDNFIDGAGYIGLAGMLSLPDPDLALNDIDRRGGGEVFDPIKPAKQTLPRAPADTPNFIKAIAEVDKDQK